MRLPTSAISRHWVAHGATTPALPTSCGPTSARPTPSFGFPCCNFCEIPGGGLLWREPPCTGDEGFLTSRPDRVLFGFIDGCAACGDVPVRDRRGAPESHCRPIVLQAEHLPSASWAKDRLTHVPSTRRQSVSIISLSPSSSNSPLRTLARRAERPSCCLR